MTTATSARPASNPEVLAIKHMAFAVRDAAAALASYARLLGVAQGARIVEYPKSRTRVALFMLGGIEYQLCESMDEDGRFSAWIRHRGCEGLHHICYAVRDIGQALVAAEAKGARLRVCKACGVAGSHPHPEGYVAFLDDEAGGVEIEFMQVYTPEEEERYRAVRGV
jgi:methylmalonyl-CoA/ethylmalonyl-CoA epimerase